MTLCSKQRRVRAGLDALLGEPNSSSDLAALRRHLIDERSAPGVLRWLAQLAPEIVAYLRGLVAGAPIDYAALCALQHLPGGAYLLRCCGRAQIVAPAVPDERRVEDLLQQFAARGPRYAALIVRRYWQFQRAALARARASCFESADAKLQSDRTALSVAFNFLVQLAEARIDLHTLAQNDLDAMLACIPHGRAQPLHLFLQWLFDAGYMQRKLSIPRTSAHKAQIALATLLRTIARATTDSCVPLDARVILLLVALGKRRRHEIARLAVRDVVRVTPAMVEVRFAHGLPLLIDGAEAQLVLELASRSNRWLFPSHRSLGQSLSLWSLSEKIRAALGISIDAVRRAAIAEALRTVAPMDLARACGYAPNTASHWRKRVMRLSQDAREYLARPVESR